MLRNLRPKFFGWKDLKLLSSTALYRKHLKLRGKGFAVGRWMFMVVRADRVA